MAKNLRLQVVLAQLGLASRRAAAQIIKAGRVKINGQVVVKPGQRVGLGKDSITVDGRTGRIQKKVYFILNKPKGVVTTVKDRYAGRCVIDLIKRKTTRIYPVGRLDKDTTGLLVLTNDGELAYRLIHPKFGIKKVYRVCIQGCLCQKTLKKLESGVFLEGAKTYPCKIKVVSKGSRKSRLEVQLSEGRKRQIKKMFACFSHPVLAIERVAFGPLKLASLKVGCSRRLGPEEIRQLKKAVGVI
ncbi:MAG: rRNA pseudouridine synthase [Candidatus Omnitrophica bacterium]|nr:rRNA pseudouridine synthase [Candidatus Omnitrophota bacterium]